MMGISQRVDEGQQNFGEGAGSLEYIVGSHEPRVLDFWTRADHNVSDWFYTNECVT